MNENNIGYLIKPYLGNNIPKKDRKTFMLLLNYLEKLPFFQMITRNHPNHWQIIFNNIVSHLIFKQFESEQIIINYGKEIPGMYIIIEGNINIYKIKKEYEKQLNNIKMVFNNNENLFEIKEKFYFSEQLTKGNDIGEEILKYNKKTAYFIAYPSTKCILGYLSKENYEKIFVKANNLEQNIINGFIINLNYFNESCFIKKIQNYIYKRFYKKNSDIFIQNADFNTFYIIYKGTINISLILKKNVKCLINEEFLLGNNSKTKRFTFSRIHELKGNYKENKSYNLINYEEGEIIGGIEFLKNLNKYLYTAKCLTDAELLEFNIKDFRHLDKIKQSQNFRNKINEQIDIFVKRIKNINNSNEKSTIFSKKNKFVRTFLENNKIEEKKK